MNKLERKWNTINRCIICFVIVELIMLISYKLYNYAPFGKNSLACMDAKIQYLDFFAYFKDVLNGENSIAYTFGKTLGGNNIAVFTYYLASPLNLLVLFFEKSQLHIFFDLLVALKLGIAAVTMHLFISERWEDCKISVFQQLLKILFSICYAMGQYSIAQSSNVMWLDGVALLPLILLGVYRVSQGKSGVLLSSSVGLSILFNWYTGGINCLASGIWIFWELFLKKVEGTENTLSWRDITYHILQYIYSMVCGVCLSAVLFLPTIVALKKSGRGSLDLSLFGNLNFRGPFMSVIEGFSLGAVSTSEKASLFCGSIIVIGIIAIFFEKKIAIKLKTFFGILLMGTLMMYYWNPLFLVFSLFKDASSYWYRYSYVGIFFVIFVAAYYYLQCANEESWNPLLKAGTCWTAILLFVNYANGSQRYNLVQYTAFFVVVLTGGVGIYFYYKCRKRMCLLSSILVFGVSLVELLISVNLQMKNYHDSGAEEFRNYSVASQQQVDAIKNKDDDFYRISQTSTYNMQPQNLTANYNEALAYNYWSISGYTSSPDDIQRRFLDRLGYRINGDNMCIVNTSIISVDSLLGVRYILSKEAISGYDAVAGDMQNGKKVYKNPYALPMAFTYPVSKFIVDTKMNPFEYQNQLYSQLMGKEVRIYKLLKYSYKFDDKGHPIYTVFIPDGKYAIYGNLPWNSEFKGTVHVDNGYSTNYACWLSPAIFYIPIESKQREVQIAVSSDNECNLKYGEEQFYALDLETFAHITDFLNEKKAKYTLKNGDIRILAKSDGDEFLYISVPYDNGWAVTVDGKKTKTGLFADCMYSIELPKGEHEIAMKYHILGLNLGVIGSCLGIVGIVLMHCSREKRKSY